MTKLNNEEILSINEVNGFLKFESCDRCKSKIEVTLGRDEFDEKTLFWRCRECRDQLQLMIDFESLIG